LLDENVDFGVSLTKGAIQEITSPEYGHTLEEKIRRRVTDELWDDRKKV